jgi:hypothetical protein
MEDLDVNKSRRLLINVRSAKVPILAGHTGQRVGCLPADVWASQMVRKPEISAEPRKDRVT